MKLFSLEMPPTEFDHAEKGDALYGSSLLVFVMNLHFSCGLLIVYLTT